MENLFSEFPSVDPKNWWAQVKKDLKETDVNVLFHEYYPGLKTEPFYVDNGNLPSSPIFKQNDWAICQSIKVDDPKRANSLALQFLQDGVSGLIFEIHGAADLSILLKGIESQYIYVCFSVTEPTSDFLTNLNAWCDQLQLTASSPGISIRCDELSQCLISGRTHPGIYENVLNLISSKSPKMQFGIDARQLKNAGANPSSELAGALAILNEYLNIAGDKAADVFSSGIRFHVAVGTDYFLEIAKLRALQNNARLLLHAYGLNIPVFIQAENSDISFSVKDIHNNVLRTSTICMSAVLGGADAVFLMPFDTFIEEQSMASAKLAKNQQLILKEESYLNKVGDPSAGSYFLEHLTDEIGGQAWEKFQETERAGGLLACVQSELIAKWIDKDAALLISEFTGGNRVIVGVNKFPNKQESIKASVKTISGENRIKSLNLGLKQVSL